MKKSIVAALTGALVAGSVLFGGGAANAALPVAPSSTIIVKTFPASSTLISPDPSKPLPAAWYHNGKKWDASISRTKCASGVATIGAYRQYVRSYGQYLLGKTYYLGVCK
jgi:hypothetical protein